MPDLSQLLNEPTRPTGAKGGLNVLRGVIRRAPTSATDSLEVVAQSYTATLTYTVPAGNWVQLGALPTVNSHCLLVIDDMGDAHVPLYGGAGTSGGGGGGEDWVKAFEQPGDPIISGSPALGGIGDIWIDTDAEAPIGPVGDKNYVHTQSVLATTWTVVHALEKFSSVEIVDSGDNVVLADIHYVDTNTLTLTFASPTTGKAYVN